MNLYALGYLAFSLLLGIAVVIVVLRANRDDLPAIVRGLLRLGPFKDDGRTDPPLPPKQ
jgi:hypothetical protein